MQGRHSFTHAYPAPPGTFTPEDCKAEGFEFNSATSAYNFLDGAATATVRVDFSPNLQHYAVTVKGPDDWSGTLLWVDGELVQVPRNDDGNPLCEKFLQWLDNRFVYAQIGGLWDHPLLEPGKLDTLGNIRGLLIYDALQRKRRLELPEPAQAWIDPVLVARDRQLRIYSCGEAVKQDTPDRVLEA